MRMGKHFIKYAYIQMLCFSQFKFITCNFSKTWMQLRYSHDFIILHFIWSSAGLFRNLVSITKLQNAHGFIFVVLFWFCIIKYKKVTSSTMRTFTKKEKKIPKSTCCDCTLLKNKNVDSINFEKMLKKYQKKKNLWMLVLTNAHNAQCISICTV